jgi:hypothetical protein
MYVRIKWSALSIGEEKTRLTGEVETLIPARMINTATRDEIVQRVCESHFDYELWEREFGGRERDVMIQVNVTAPMQVVGEFVVVLVKSINAVVRSCNEKVGSR